MSASHFFVGLGAGIAILAVPVLTFTPGLNGPQRLVEWINGPSSAASALQAAKADDAAATRPLHGYRPGDATPVETADAPPTLQARAPTATPQALAQTGQAPAGILSILGTGGSGGSPLRTGVIRSGGTQVAVRRVAGVESSDDPLIADGAPVLVSTGAGLQVSGTQWRAIRGLNGVAGWVPGAQVAVDGEAQPTPIAPPMLVATTPTPAGSSQGTIANTGGVGVVLRNSPNDADRSHTGLTDGSRVAVLDRSPTGEWVRIRDDKGHEGWVPGRYLATTG